MCNYQENTNFVRNPVSHHADHFADDFAETPGCLWRQLPRKHWSKIRPTHLFLSSVGALALLLLCASDWMHAISKVVASSIDLSKWTLSVMHVLSSSILAVHRALSKQHVFSSWLIASSQLHAACEVSARCVLSLNSLFCFAIKRLFLSTVTHDKVVLMHDAYIAGPQRQLCGWCDVVFPRMLPTFGWKIAFSKSFFMRMSEHVKLRPWRIELVLIKQSFETNIRGSLVFPLK